MEQTTVNLTRGVEAAWTTFMVFLPKALMFLGILVVGYFLSKLSCRIVDRVLERVGFDRLVERGGVKRTLARSGYDASDIMAKIVFYTVFLFVLQLAFSVFGENPVSVLLTRIVAFLPNIFIALLIVVIAAAVARAVKELTWVALGGLSYGRHLATLAAAGVMVVGIFAALNQVGIAPAIVNGLFYAMLAVVVGSAIVAIGGGGIAPMRSRWEKALGRLESEAPRVREEAERANPRIHAWKGSEAETRPIAANE